MTDIIEKEKINEILEKTEKEQFEIAKRTVLEGGNILKIKDNRTFKILFSERQKKFVTWFIANILERPISDIKDVITIKNNELTPLNSFDKGKTVDFLVELKNELIVIEMNNNNSGINYTRNLYYVFHTLLNKVMIGEDYKEISAYLINLNWFDDNFVIKNKLKPITTIKYPYPILGMEYEKSIVTVKNVNLSFYDKKVYNGIKMKGFLWKLMTIDNLEEIKDIKKNLPELANYCDELIYISQDKEHIMFVWDERMEKKFEKIPLEEAKKFGREEGRQEGFKEGKAIGVKESKKEFISNMLKKNLSIEQMAEYLNMNIQEIKDIIDEINNND